MIHDLLSYNISNMSYFLSIVKDKERLNNLADLYELESNIFGKNVFTFQRTLYDFTSMEPLLIDIGDKEMTSQELEELYSVIINRNYGDIRTKEELFNYQNMVKNKLMNDIKDIEDIDYIKEKVCNALFGINYNNEIYNFERLERTAYFYHNLYEGSNAYNSQILSFEEKSMMDFLSIIFQEQGKSNIISILNNLFNEINVLGNKCFITAINKIKNNQEDLLNQNLISVEKLEEEISKKNGLVLKTTRHGVPIYILNGIEFGSLSHNIGGANNEYIRSSVNENATSLRNIETLEQQFGSSTISTWYNSNLTYENKPTSYRDYSVCSIGFSKIPRGTIVGMDTPGRNGSDISTDHAPKLVSSTAVGGNINFDIMHDSGMRQEVSFYRKVRDQSEITNENRGGRFDFDYFYGSICMEDLSNLDELDLRLYGDGFDLFGEAEKRNKPIILVNTYAYSKNKEIMDNIEKEGISL